MRTRFTTRIGRVKHSKIVFEGKSKWRAALLLLVIFSSVISWTQVIEARITGSVLDPSGLAVAGAHIEVDSTSGAHLSTTTDKNGAFSVSLPARGNYRVRAEAAGFAPVLSNVQATSPATNIELHLSNLSAINQEIVVAADMSQIEIASPDPSQKIMVREELLDANPARPGAPISIPGLPIESASGGIKAPQYFAPGVAGDHGEPIAQYIAVGGYLVPNNLSANAHGNGYADPNIYISAALSSVATDGGAFNVLEGNHALNLAATYSVRPRLRRFATLTGDFRDVDLTVGLSPAAKEKKAWLALESNYGNGLMRTLEHRQQYKWNALRSLHPSKHEITLFSDGYFGLSHEGNLVPIGSGVQVNDTIDRRQKDQTHTSILAANDEWGAGNKDAAAFSGFFRTYNLALFSNFGEGLIRQSEFRTVEGAEARETHAFTPRLQSIAGVLFNQDDIHNDDLDHYLSDVSRVYGPFVKVLSNNITIRGLAPYVALRADLGRHLHAYLGSRFDEVQMANSDKIKPNYSFNQWKGLENPKATLTWFPGNGGSHFLPSASISFGQAFFTQDPRINLAPSVTETGAGALANPFVRSHSEQFVLEKGIAGTNLRVTVGQTTTTATLGKIDPDNGSSQDLGPGSIKFLTAIARHTFDFGTIQATFSKADARLKTFDGVEGTVTPEAPRTIFDALMALEKLPMGFLGRAEYEYVGHRFLDGGNQEHPNQFEAIPVGETRIALLRPFLKGKLDLGVEGLIARGYTGQTTETFDPSWSIATSATNLPYCAPGSGSSGLGNDFDCGTIERSVGIRTVSWVGGSISWRFNSEK